MSGVLSFFGFIGLLFLSLPYLGFGGMALVTILHFMYSISWWWITVPALLAALYIYIIIHP
jgi:hypothetical protein